MRVPLLNASWYEAMNNGSYKTVDNARQEGSVTMQTLIHNATLILPERLIEGGWLFIENGRILDLGEGAMSPTFAPHSIDACGQFLLPGLIDLHCDTIEKCVEPRPKVHFDIHIALVEADWRLAGS